MDNDEGVEYLKIISEANVRVIAILCVKLTKWNIENTTKSEVTYKINNFVECKNLKWVGIIEAGRHNS